MILVGELYPKIENMSSSLAMRVNLFFNGGDGGSSHGMAKQGTTIPIRECAHQHKTPPAKVDHTEEQGWRWTQAHRRRGGGRGGGGAGDRASRAAHPLPEAASARQPASDVNVGLGAGDERDRLARATHPLPDTPRVRQQAMDADRCHVVRENGGAITRGRGGGHSRGGSSHHLTRSPHSGNHVSFNSSEPVRITGNEPRLTLCPPASSHSINDEEDMDPVTIMEVDKQGKGKRKLGSSPPLLLMSSLAQRAESSTDAHRLFVDKVEQALRVNKVPSETQSDSDGLDIDSESEESEDERTLWEIHKSIQKGARDRKGMQSLSTVQKKKIQKKKVKGRAGGKCF